MIRCGKAERGDLPALTALWQTCFGDSAAEINAFWDMLFDTITVFAATTAHAPESMLCALPAELVLGNGERLPAAYLYAVCTVPERRGQGLCHALMAYAEQSLSEHGAVCMALVPDGQALFRFYESMGYRTAFFHKTYSVAAGGTADISPLDAADYRTLREHCLQAAYLSYGVPLLRWQRRCGESTGAGLYRVQTPAGICCAAAEKRGERLLCKELLPDVPEAAAALAAALGCSSAAVRTVGGSAPFGMCKPLCGIAAPPTAYLGLAFD